MYLTDFEDGLFLTEAITLLVINVASLCRESESIGERQEVSSHTTAQSKTHRFLPVSSTVTEFRFTRILCATYYKCKGYSWYSGSPVTNSL